MLEAKVRLVPNPAMRVLLALGFIDLPTAADSMDLILCHKPIALEGMERPMLNAFEQKPGMREKIALLPEGKGLMLAEFGGASLDGARHVARETMAELSRMAAPPAMKLIEIPSRMRDIWDLREAALGAASRDENGREFWGGWEDAAVPPERLGSYLREFYRLVESHHYRGFLYGHFGQGCIHARFNFNFGTSEGVRKFRSFVEEAADLVVRFGGSLSGEHGDGQARGELYPKMFGPELVQAFREFKAIWDPAGKMNPGKVVDPYPLDANLRIGPSYQPWKPKSNFGFPEDHGSFERAVARCVGIGKCRREEGEIMCPSYRVTREEQHSTRGRARLLFEMLNRDMIKDGWRDPHVYGALDLCLACKGCKSECPVSVDMAAYKAEFLSHYYQGRLRPRSAYAFGMVFRWARMASRFPGLANFLTQSPRAGEWLKRRVGISPERKIPALAPQTFKAWFRRRAPRNSGLPPVVLWADTFNNYFSPAVSIAAVETLEAAGFRVIVPKQALCCGRPLYDYGMLGLARRKLRQTLKALAPYIEENVPVVGLEPSCVAVFRDELLNLFPGHPDAQKLAGQSSLLGEFLARHNYTPPPLKRKALLHGHCHQKAIAGMESDLSILERMGVEVEPLDSGCCGMAGGFGYEKDHYEVSVKVGELVLLPAVRKAPKDTLIITDGFSCREQVLQ
ncbi:MAG: FAD-binding and (Fe-S)-binding domain-containing protein, partial [Terriglobia bacterium]